MKNTKIFNLSDRYGSMKIYLDYRERKILKYVVEISDYTEITNLPVGDILISSAEEGVLIERKSAMDFIESMKNNRLWEQLRRMQTSEVWSVKISRRALLICGLLTPALIESRIKWNNVMGAFMEIQFNYGIPIFHAEDENALKEFLRILVKREKESKNSGEIKKLWARIPPHREMSEEEWRIYVLSSLPFIGETIAKKLLKKFGSIEKIARASIVELKKVEGIGDKKARKIYRIFH